MTPIKKTDEQGRRRTHAEMLPDIVASNAAWRAEHLPKLAKARAEAASRRDRVTAAINEGLDKIDADQSIRSEVAYVTGLLVRNEEPRP